MGTAKAVGVESVPREEGGTAPRTDQVRTTMALDGDGSSIARARHCATVFLHRVRTEQAVPVSDRALEAVRLVTSELVTNALKYAPGPVLLDLLITGDLIEVQVWDSDPALPVAQAADAGRVGQHGLEIVMALAQGVEFQREPVGKRITVRIALTDDPGGAITGRHPE